MTDNNRVPWASLERDREYNFHSLQTNDSQNDSLNFHGPEHVSVYNNLSFDCHYYDPNDVIKKYGTNSNLCSRNLLAGWNVGSLPAKFIKLKDELAVLSEGGVRFDVLALQEVWNAKLGDDFEIQGYQKPIFKVRGCKNPHGGVGIYVKDGLNFSVLENLGGGKKMSLSQFGSR